MSPQTKDLSVPKENTFDGLSKKCVNTRDKVMDKTNGPKDMRGQGMQGFMVKQHTVRTSIT